MLSKLTVCNLALIERLDIEPCERLNILSGETGAGKSIIVDGLMLLLGARYDKTLLRYGAESGFVEGVFDAHTRTKACMQAFGWEEEDIIVIHRKFAADGRNDIRINGRSATTGMLKQITASLVDIYGQNEYQLLMRAGEHLRILDAYARESMEEARHEYEAQYMAYRETLAALADIGDAAAREREIDLLRYQIDEIEGAKTYENEEQELTERRTVITSAERIFAALGKAVDLLGENEEHCAADMTQEAAREISGIASLKASYAELDERLRSLAIEMSDICDALRDELEGTTFSMEELDELEKRLAFVRSLARKYGTYANMCKFLAQSKERLAFLESADDRYEKLCARKAEIFDKMYAAAKALHDMRMRAADEFAEKIKAELHTLGMEHADFAVVLSDFPERTRFESVYSASGADAAEFYLAPNVGQPLKPLTKIISGGEMSRFMLALKVISNASDVPTMIFDEIDAGISGTTGQVVAKKLAELSRKHQILCVTHLPQIASMADRHFFIRKQTQAQSTVTTVTPLDEQGMIGEISRLSGSKGISEQSYANAATMKKWSDDYKASL